MMLLLLLLLLLDSMLRGYGGGGGGRFGVEVVVKVMVFVLVVGILRIVGAVVSVMLMRLFFG